jgi:cell division septation protein DedD
MHRLWRIWSRRAMIAASVIALAGTAMVGVRLMADALTPVALPAPPEAPARALPGISASEVPSAAVSGVDEEYLVAVGLFSSRDRADQIVDALTQAGLPARQQPFRLRRQQVQQIVLGPYFSRDDATAHLERLLQLGGYDGARLIDRGRNP